eukprot:g21076.t1
MGKSKSVTYVSNHDFNAMTKPPKSRFCEDQLWKSASRTVITQKERSQSLPYKRPHHYGWSPTVPGCSAVSSSAPSMPPKKSNWNFLQQAHRANLIREEDVDSGNYQGGLSTKRLDREDDDDRQEEDAMLSDLSSSDEDAPQIKVPLSKDEALAAVQRSKVLKGLSIHGQVRVAALLRRCSYQPGERLWSGQEGDEKRLVLIESGEAELWLPEGDGERFVGTCGPRKVLGGLFAVGSASRQIFSVRVPDLEEAKVLHAWEIDSRDLEQFESLFNASDLTAFRRRVLQDVRIQVIP